MKASTGSTRLFDLVRDLAETEDAAYSTQLERLRAALEVFSSAGRRSSSDLELPTEACAALEDLDYL